MKAAVVTGVLAFVAGLLVCLFFPRERASTGESIVVPLTPRFAEADLVDVTLDLKLPAPSARVVESIREKYRIEGPIADLTEPSGEIIGTVVMGEFELPPLRYGGDALVTREPDGRVALRVAPADASRREWINSWRVGAGLVNGRGAYWGRGDLFRVGRVYAVAEGGYRHESDGYAMIGVEVRIR